MHSSSTFRLLKDSAFWFIKECKHHICGVETQTYTVLIIHVMDFIDSQTFFLIQFLLLLNKHKTTDKISDSVKTKLLIYNQMQRTCGQICYKRCKTPIIMCKRKSKDIKINEWLNTTFCLFCFTLVKIKRLFSNSVEFVSALYFFVLFSLIWWTM